MSLTLIPFPSLPHLRNVGGENTKTTALNSKRIHAILETMSSYSEDKDISTRQQFHEVLKFTKPRQL